jgi:hypothetical protein
VLSAIRTSHFLQPIVSSLSSVQSVEDSCYIPLRIRDIAAEEKRVNPILILLPWFLVGALVLYVLTRAIGVVWIKYRVKMAVLKRLEREPDLLASPKRMETAVSEAAARYKAYSRQDLVMTGLVLAMIGLCGIGLGLELRSGSLAVGAYVGGFVCALLGSALALMTMFFRWTARPRFQDYALKDEHREDRGESE